MVELRVLGEVGAWIGDRRVDVGHARQRCVFAVLAVEANRVVTVDQLLERVWSQDLPLRGRQVLRNYLSRLRLLLLSPEGIGIERRPDGYVLLADPDVVDLHRFRHLIARTREAEDDRAPGLFDQALALWRGEPCGFVARAARRCRVSVRWPPRLGPCRIQRRWRGRR